jgi:hypothetical protein
MADTQRTRNAAAVFGSTAEHRTRRPPVPFRSPCVHHMGCGWTAGAAAVRYSLHPVYRRCSGAAVCGLSPLLWHVWWVGKKEQSVSAPATRRVRAAPGGGPRPPPPPPRPSLTCVRRMPCIWPPNGVLDSPPALDRAKAATKKTQKLSC